MTNGESRSLTGTPHERLPARGQVSTGQKQEDDGFLVVVADQLGRHTVMMIPDPGAVVIEIVRRAADPGVTESDVIRWVGVTVAVAGVVLATPDGIAAAWRLVKNWHLRAWALARRLLRLPGQEVSMAGMTAMEMTMAGKGFVERWQPWREDARDDEKIDILHKQIDSVHDQIGELRAQIDRTADDLRKEIREAEDHAIGQLRQLASEMRGERSQASRVDARGFGPIALGIMMTGLPDELATVAAVGWLAVAVAVIWTAGAFPSWLRDYRQALKYSNGLYGRGLRRSGGGTAGPRSGPTVALGHPGESG